MCRKSLFIALSACVPILAPTAARAGLYEKLSTTEIPRDGSPASATAGSGETRRDIMLTAPATPHLFDERAEPIFLLRTIFVSTFEDTVKVPGSEPGQTSEVESAIMDPSQFGHREGFVLENVELGLRGRFNDSAIYYKGKFVHVLIDGNKMEYTAYSGNGKEVLDQFEMQK